MISIITPSTRNDMLPIVEKCLKRQDFEDFEWIITSPIEITSVKPDVLLKDPPKLKGDFWTLCKGWNQAWAKAKGELILNIQDGVWFPPDMLSKFWFHYKTKPRGVVSAIGHQYDQFDELGVPVNKMWHDPRSKNEKFLEETLPSEMEMVICSLPKQAILDCGGIDEIYDTCPAAGEKEMCYRLNRLGYEFYIDQNIEYRAIHHPRLTGNWDRLYLEVTAPLFTKHMGEIVNGTRPLNVECVLKYVA